jgi:O-antigen ligase
LLKLAAFSIVGFPPYLVFAPVGASGAAAQLLALLLLATWMASALFGHHDPSRFGNPGRLAVGVFVLSSCASYAWMAAGLSGATTADGRASADRWMVLAFASAALAIVTTECVRTLDDAMALARWTLAGGTVCALAALIQFVFQINPVEWLKPVMVGFVDNASATPFQPRGALMRVSGTTMHPIELGAVAAMLLPLAVWRALYDGRGQRWRHWVVVVLIALSNVFTVSRTGMIGLLMAVAITVPFLPTVPRKWALVIVPAGIVGLFVGVPGLVSTLFGSATAGTSDASITYRVDDYPLAFSLVAARPGLGLGPGTWMPDNARDIFDNQYLLVSVTMGVVGLIGFLAYLLLPAYAALAAARKAKQQELRLLGTSVGAAGLIATVASGTFDSMSFLVFALLVPFFIGLSGAVWLMVKEQMASGT